MDPLNQMSSLCPTRHWVFRSCHVPTGLILGGWRLGPHIEKYIQSTSIKKTNHAYTELSVVSITPTTIRSSVMRCHSLSTWGFEDTDGMSCVLSSAASSFDSSSQSHRATRPSWTESAKDYNQQRQVCDSIDSNSSLCQTFPSEQQPIRYACSGLLKCHLKTKRLSVKTQHNYP